jgi:hypothetical protein
VADVSGDLMLSFVAASLGVFVFTRLFVCVCVCVCAFQHVSVLVGCSIDSFTGAARRVEDLLRLSVLYYRRPTLASKRRKSEERTVQLWFGSLGGKCRGCYRSSEFSRLPVHASRASFFSHARYANNDERSNNYVQTAPPKERTRNILPLISY